MCTTTKNKNPDQNRGVFDNSRTDLPVHAETWKIGGVGVEY